MKKVIKIKQSDLENIVSNIVNEMEQPVSNSITEPTNGDVESEEPNTSGGNGGFVVGIDRNGKHYLINVETNEIIAEK